MEFANGVALRSPSRYYYPGAGINTQYRKSCLSPTSSSIGFDWNSGKSLYNRKLRAQPRKIGNFEEKSTLGYYHSYVICGDGKKKLLKNRKEKKESWNGMSTKKKLKLLKGLTKDLSTFSELSFGMNISDQGLLVNEDKTRIISEAAEVLLAQVRELRAEQEELLLNTKKKGERATIDSESSSSESSDSESDCDEEVVDMSRLRNQAAETAYVQHTGENKYQPPGMEVTFASLPMKTSSSVESQLMSALSLDKKCCTNGDTTRNAGGSSLVQLEKSSLTAAEDTRSISSVHTVSNSIDSSVLEGKRVEVCMGKKCAKSGGPALMEDFQKVLGFEGAVVSCKCLGKCKYGPNVRIVNSVDTAETVSTDDSVRVPSNPLCLTVSPEDVGLIVASYFADDHQTKAIVAASAE